MSTNRLFIENVPLQVVQNLVTALDPTLLTEHSMMLLFNDVSRMLPIEELPKRLLDVLVEFFQSAKAEDDGTEDDDETRTAH